MDAKASEVTNSVDEQFVFGKESAEDAKEKAGDAVESVKENASEAGFKISNAFHSITDSMESDSAHKTGEAFNEPRNGIGDNLQKNVDAVKEIAGNVAEGVKDKADDVAEDVRGSITEAVSKLSEAFNSTIPEDIVNEAY